MSKGSALHSEYSVHPTSSIAGVIAALDAIVAQSSKDGNRLGYFAALYNKVTRAVAEAIDRREFEDNARMERFDVIFANRYLDALAAWQAGRFPGHAWQQAFLAARKWHPLVMQHLLLGMNAHINLDLGIVAAQIVEGSSLHSLRDDFLRINTILAGLVAEVENDLAKIWPPFGWLTEMTADDVFINFSMKRARDEAWEFATELFDAAPSAQARLIDHRDACVAKQARVLVRPPGWAQALLLPIRVFERGTTVWKIQALT
jgi:hypothetical protein